MHCIVRCGVYVATYKESVLHETLREEGIADSGDADWGYDQGSEEENDISEDKEDEVTNSETASGYDAEDELRGCAVKRRRLRRLSHGHNFLPEEGVAVIPSVSGECRVSREMAPSVFVFDWAGQTKKPNHLRVLTEVYRPGFPPVLFRFTSRETGTTHYASREIFNCLSFRWLLYYCPPRSEAFSRMPLLLSPSSCELSVEGVNVSLN